MTIHKILPTIVSALILITGCNSVPKESACDEGLTLCGEQCLDIMSDSQNCGRCNNTCTVENGQATCQEGNCKIGSCDLPYHDCDQQYSTGCESNSGTDNNNCGSCDNVCNYDNGVGTCQEGSCLLASCSPPFDNCDDNPETGCETNTDDSLLHCGECLNDCPANHFCDQGGCLPFEDDVLPDQRHD